MTSEPSRFEGVALFQPIAVAHPQVDMVPKHQSQQNHAKLKQNAASPGLPPRSNGASATQQNTRTFNDFHLCEPFRNSGLISQKMSKDLLQYDTTRSHQPLRKPQPFRSSRRRRLTGEAAIKLEHTLRTIPKLR